MVVACSLVSSFFMPVSSVCIDLFYIIPIDSHTFCGIQHLVLKRTIDRYMLIDDCASSCT